MKRFLALLLAILMLSLTFAGCKEAEPQKEPVEPEPPAVIEPVEERKAREYIELLDSLASLEWESPEEISPANFVFWYGYRIKDSSTEESPWKKYSIKDRDGVFFPQEEFEAAIQTCFDVSAEHLRSDPVFLKEEELYQTPAALYPLAARTYDITGFVRDGSVITVQYTITYPEYGDTEQMVLTAEETEEGVRFLSNLSRP